MAQSLEEYVAQANTAYSPAKTAIQSQINALSGNLDTANNKINSQYNTQVDSLNRSRDQAAESASLAAAGNGGSFGGAGEIANRKYYEQTYTPALSQLESNRSNALDAARQNYENQLASYNSQLANIDAQANQAALAQYWNAQEAERQRAAQAAQNDAYYRYLMESAKKQNSGYNLSSQRNMYGGFDWTDAEGNKHTVSTVAASAAGSGQGNKFNESLFDALSLAGNQGDYYSQVVAEELKNGARFAKNGTGNSTGNSMYDTLGIYRVN